MLAYVSYTLAQINDLASASASSVNFEPGCETTESSARNVGEIQPSVLDEEIHSNMYGWRLHLMNIGEVFRGDSYPLLSVVPSLILPLGINITIVSPKIDS